MVTKLNVIMKYNRTKSVWVCPDCDTENEIDSGNCFTCDLPKPPNSRIITPESERMEMEDSVTIVGGNHYPTMPSGAYSPPIAPPASDYHYYSSGDSSSSSKKTGVIAAIVVAVVAIIAIILICLYSSGFFSEDNYYNYEYNSTLGADMFNNSSAEQDITI